MLGHLQANNKIEASTQIEPIFKVYQADARAIDFQFGLIEPDPIDTHNVNDTACLRHLEPSAKTAADIQYGRRLEVFHHNIEDALGGCRVGCLLSGKLPAVQVLIDAFSFVTWLVRHGLDAFPLPSFKHVSQ